MMTKNLLYVALITSIFIQSAGAMEAPIQEVKAIEVESEQATLLGVPAEVKLMVVQLLADCEYQWQGAQAIKNLRNTCTVWRDFIDDSTFRILTFLGTNPRFRLTNLPYLTNHEALWAAAQLRTRGAFNWLNECGIDQLEADLRDMKRYGCAEGFIRMHDFLMASYAKRKNYKLARVQYDHYANNLKAPKNLIVRLENILTYGQSIQHIARYMKALSDNKADWAAFINKPTVQRMILYTLTNRFSEPNEKKSQWQLDTNMAQEYENWLEKVELEYRPAGDLQP